MVNVKKKKNKPDTAHKEIRLRSLKTTKIRDIIEWLLVCVVAMAMAMASTASTLSWSSSSWLHSFGGNFNEASKPTDRRTASVILAQKKAKKTRKV